MNNDNTLESSSAINTHALKKFKIVFLGDQGVGKTSIIKRFIFDNFDENNSATIGVDLISKNITVENKTVRLNLWDTAGQERFRCLIPGYIRDSNVAIIVYDITRKDTFASLQNWVNDVRSQREDDVVLSLIGCKADLEARREVTYEEGQKFAENNNALFCEVSAKTGNNIAQSFQNVVNRLMGAIVTAPIQIPASTEGRESRIQLGQNIDHSAINDGTRENLTVIKDKKSGGCCS